MRLFLLAFLAVTLPAPASAMCRCACVGGASRPICDALELTPPLCADLCLSSQVQPLLAVRPIAGGRKATNVIEPFNPAPLDNTRRDPDYNVDTNGNPLGMVDPQANPNALGTFGAGR